MPHRCMNCGKEYSEGSEELVEGCECGSTLFLYEKGGEDQEVQDDEVMQEVDQFLKSVKEDGKREDDSDVVFNLPSIKVEDEGVYNINLKKLLENAPLIVEVKDNKFYLHLASLFNREGKLKAKDLEEAEQS